MVVRSLFLLYLVFRQDDPSDAFYIVMSGRVLVTKRLETGFVVIPPLAGFGELGIINKTARAATCTADGETDLVRVSAEDYEKIFQMKHLREIAERVAFLRDVCALLCSSPLSLRSSYSHIVDIRLTPPQ
jgi:CRP-like cAMP-binding protein